MFVAVLAGPQGVKEGEKRRTVWLFNEMMPTAVCEIWIAI